MKKNYVSILIKFKTSFTSLINRGTEDLDSLNYVIYPIYLNKQAAYFCYQTKSLANVRSIGFYPFEINLLVDSDFIN